MIPEKFWSLVDQDYGPDKCWPWMGFINQSGYGQVGRSGSAHRIAYELTNGSIPVGMQIDHLCRNRACVNPRHLEAVTSAENTRRGTGGKHLGAMHRAKTHCPHGHEYSATNTRVSRGKRLCKECGRLNARRRYWHLKEAS